MGRVVVNSDSCINFNLRSRRLTSLPAFLVMESNIETRGNEHLVVEVGNCDSGIRSGAHSPFNLERGSPLPMRL